MTPPTAFPLTTDNLNSVWHNLAQKSNGLQSTLTPAVQENLVAYLELLVKWNRVMNLVGPYSWPEILEILLVDSFYLANFLKTLPLPESPRSWDLGAGAGLPGVPLRMVWQKGDYTLVEAREKRALFLQTVLSACSLPSTDVFRGRAEAFMPESPKADIVISRAFLPWEKVLSLVEPWMQPQGYCVFLTLTPPPVELPSTWKVTNDDMYYVGQDKRFFWAIRYM